jgi:hypothetical protein
MSTEKQSEREREKEKEKENEKVQLAKTKTILFIIFQKATIAALHSVLTGIPVHRKCGWPGNAGC